jgi:hypothetical protein
VVISAFTAGVYPQIAKIVRPPQKFVETIGGNVEREKKSKEFKFYIPDGEFSSSVSNVESELSRLDICDGDKFRKVFIHPSSVNFSNFRFKHSSYLLYGESQITSDNQKSLEKARIYIRETTEPTQYSLLLFGGNLEVLYDSQTVLLDGWIR